MVSGNSCVSMTTSGSGYVMRKTGKSMYLCNETECTERFPDVTTLWKPDDSRGRAKRTAYWIFIFEVLEAIRAAGFPKPMECHYTTAQRINGQRQRLEIWFSKMVDAPLTKSYLHSRLLKKSIHYKTNVSNDEIIRGCCSYFASVSALHVWCQTALLIPGYWYFQQEFSVFHH